MLRVTSASTQYILGNGIQKTLSDVAKTQLQMSSGKISGNYSELKTDAGSIVTSRAVIKREEAYMKSADRAATTLWLYNEHMTSMYDGLQRVETLLLTASSGDVSGLSAELESLYSQVRFSLNAKDGEGFLFEGSDPNRQPLEIRTFAEFTALPDTAGVLDAAGPRKQARVGDDRVIAIGYSAADSAQGILDVLHKIGQMDLNKERLEPAEIEQLVSYVSDIREARDLLNLQRANVGRQQQEMDRIKENAQKRSNVLAQVVSAGEDVNLGEVATRLMTLQSSLQASMQAFVAFKDMTLANYLR